MWRVLRKIHSSRVASKPARDLSVEERRFALQYLFQANPQNVIGRYPRYKELWDRFRAHGDHPERAERYFQPQDFTDLQVLSQIAWFDEFFLEEKDIAALVAKGHSYSLDDQKFVIAREEGAAGTSSSGSCRGGEEGINRAFGDAVLSPDSAIGVRYECRGGVVAGLAPAAEPVSPSGGCAGAIGARTRSARESFWNASQGRMAVGRQRIGRGAGNCAQSWASSGWRPMRACWGAARDCFFSRDGNGRLPRRSGGEALQHPSLRERLDARCTWYFAITRISDLIGFVYSGMPPADAAAAPDRQHQGSGASRCWPRGATRWCRSFSMARMRGSTYPKSGREFLRRFYDGLQHEPGVEAVTISEAIARHKDFGKLTLARARIVDQRELQCVDRGAGGQSRLGLSASCA